MTNSEFQKKLEKMYESHSIITKGKRKTFSELVWTLRRDNVDYNIRIPPYKEDGWRYIPSVKECLIPIKWLAMHVKAVELDECEDDDFEYDGICLTVWLEE